MHLNEYSEPCDEEASSGYRCSVDEEADLPPVLYSNVYFRKCRGCVVIGSVDLPWG